MSVDEREGFGPCRGLCVSPAACSGMALVLGFLQRVQHHDDLASTSRLLAVPPSPVCPPQVGREELIQFLRRTSRSSAPPGGGGASSAYRGVSRHAKGRWEARIGLSPVDGKRRYRYLGLYDTEVEAAVAYDRAAVEIKGLSATLNFPMSNYLDAMDEGKGAWLLPQGTGRVNYLLFAQTFEQC